MLPRGARHGCSWTEQPALGRGRLGRGGVGTRREETRSMSEFRLPAAPKVRTIKVTGIVRRRCDLGPIWGRNTAEVEKVHTQKRAQPISSL